MLQKYPLLSTAAIVAMLIIAGSAMIYMQKSDIEKHFLKILITTKDVLDLSETYKLLEIIQSDDIVTLESELTKKMDEQLLMLLQISDEVFLEEKCIPYTFLKYRTNLEGEDSNMTLTKLLEERVKPNSKCLKMNQGKL